MKLQDIEKQALKTETEIEKSLNFAHSVYG